MAELSQVAALEARAWELCYVDADAAREIGLQLIALGDAGACAGWLQVAMADGRVGPLAAAAETLTQARDAAARAGDALCSLYCDEIQAILLRRGQDAEGSCRLQAEIDARPKRSDDPMYRFFAHNSRALSAKVLGRFEVVLRHLYAAMEAARQTGWQGPQLTVTANLGGYHLDLHNIDDGCRLCEEALSLSRSIGCWGLVSVCAANMLMGNHMQGRTEAARQLAEELLSNEAHIPDVRRIRACEIALGYLGTGDVEAALALLDVGPIPTGDGNGLMKWAWIKGRCLLALGDAEGARSLAERALGQIGSAYASGYPYELMALYQTLTDACEQTGDLRAALDSLRRAHALHEKMIGRSARARFIALEVGHQLQTVQHERDAAIDFGRSADDDRRRLTELNNALQAKIEETELLHLKLRELALRDPLTGLHNRRHLYANAPAFIELARRHDRDLCVVLMDLDHFKLLNDTYGHDAGDKVLQHFSKLLTETLRSSDIVVRHGGEEFVAVMPDIDASGAHAMVQRLQEAVQASPVDIGRRRLPRVSFSAGIALFPRHGQTLEQLLTRADRGLYAAKHHGRARIELAPATGFAILA